ncbi:MAG: hypothetical protein KAR06_05585 [Deltaproteobacteria bacterium]|nr:hypothetical protein [Deltaproteobacteria bacterium]
MSFNKRIATIKGLSQERRIPRLGKIRLGFKINKGNGSYPAELPFFLLPKEVAKKYGGNVTVARAKDMGVTRQDVLDFIADNTFRLAEELPIMLPVNEIEAVFPQAYKWWGQSRGVKCTGNGDRALLYNEETKAMDEITCPCEKLKSSDNPRGVCTQQANLMCLIPDVSVGGVYQIDIGSINSIIDINSGIDYAERIIGRFAMVPLKLRRIPTETHHDGKKQVHYTMQLILDVSVSNVEALRANNKRILTHTQAHIALPEPEGNNPVFDSEEDGAAVVDQDTDNGINDLEEEWREPEPDAKDDVPQTTVQDFEFPSDDAPEDKSKEEGDVTIGFKEFMAKILAVNNLPHLENTWNKYKHLVPTFSDEGQKMITKAGNKRKERLTMGCTTDALACEHSVWLKDKTAGCEVTGSGCPYNTKKAEA